jgi:putative membrane protein
MLQNQLKAILFATLASFLLMTMAAFAQNDTGMAKPAQPMPSSQNSMNNSANENHANNMNNSAQPIQTHKPLSSQDKQFLDKLARGSEGEVALGKYMEQKAANPQVKEFAERMVHDHSILDAQAKKVFADFGLQPPPPDTAGQQKLQAELDKESGKKLDDTYIDAQIKEHEQDLALITPQADHGEKLVPSDPTISELAEEVRPVVEQHLQLAQMVAKEIGATPAQTAKMK